MDPRTFSFHVVCPAAKMYLVGRKEGQSAFILEMQKDDGDWFARLELREGTYRLRYYFADNRQVTYWNPAHTTGTLEDGLDAVLNVPHTSDVSMGKEPELSPVSFQLNRFASMMN